MDIIKGQNNKGIGLIGALIIATAFSFIFLAATNIFLPYEQKVYHSRVRYSIERLKGQTVRLPHSAILKSIPENPHFIKCFEEEKGCSAKAPFTLLDPTGDLNNPISSGSGVAYDGYGSRCQSSPHSRLCPLLLKSEALIQNGDFKIRYTLILHKSVPVVSQEYSWETPAPIKYIKNTKEFHSIYYCSSKEYLKGIDHRGDAICVKRPKTRTIPHFSGDLGDLLNLASDVVDIFKVL